MRLGLIALTLIYGCTLNRAAFEKSGPTDASAEVPDTGMSDAGVLMDGAVDGSFFDVGPTFVDSTFEDAAGPDALVPDVGVDAPMPVDGGCSFATSCVGGVLVRCIDGVPQMTSCPLGCAPAEARCTRFVPSNVPATLSSSSDDVVLPGSIRTNDQGCSDMGAVVVNQVTGGSTVCAWAARSFALPSGQTTVVTGPRPLVLVASETIRIAGTLDVSASGEQSGPGGAAGGDATSASGAGPSGGTGGDRLGTYEEGGGGGGGSCSPGGAGGRGGDESGGAGGAAFATTDLRPLRGGSGGGRGGNTETLGRGGAGGGAVQLSSGGEILVSGSILAGGGGGDAGGFENTTGVNVGAGGGGGGGGGILIEAPSVTITDSARLFAGGGGGGSGATLENPSRGDDSGSDGEDGNRMNRAAGGLGDPQDFRTYYGANGGRGGGGNNIVGGTGEDNTGANANGGGGGGGAGCLVLSTGADIRSTQLNPPNPRLIPLITN